MIYSFCCLYDITLICCINYTKKTYFCVPKYKQYVVIRTWIHSTPQRENKETQNQKANASVPRLRNRSFTTLISQIKLQSITHRTSTHSTHDPIIFFSFWKNENNISSICRVTLNAQIETKGT